MKFIDKVCRKYADSCFLSAFSRLSELNAGMLIKMYTLQNAEMPRGGWVEFLQLYDKLNLKSRPAIMHFLIFFISWMSLSNSFDVEVWIIWRSWKFGEG